MSYGVAEITSTRFTANISVEKNIHPLYQDWLQYRDSPNITTRLRANPLVGKWHYRYYSTKGEISLVELLDYFRDGVDYWEIMCGSHTNFFDDVERFLTRDEAEVRIKELLD